MNSYDIVATSRPIIRPSLQMQAVQRLLLLLITEHATCGGVQGGCSACFVSVLVERLPARSWGVAQLPAGTPRRLIFPIHARAVRLLLLLPVPEHAACGGAQGGCRTGIVFLSGGTTACSLQRQRSAVRGARRPGRCRRAACDLWVDFDLAGPGGRVQALGRRGCS